MNVTPAANHLNILDPSKLLVSTETGGSLQPIENADAFSSSAVFDPSYRYATIQKDGKTIATVYKSGFVEAGNGYGLPNDLTMDGEGLALANKRIEQLLKLYGGHVEYIQDTRTQAASATAATLFAAQQASQKR